MDVSILFGRFLVRKGLLTEHDLAEAVSVQSELNGSLALRALDAGLISLADFKKCLAYQREKGVTFRQAMVAANVAEPDRMKLIDDTLRQSRMKLGEVLVCRGNLSQEALDEALAEFRESTHT